MRVHISLSYLLIHALHSKLDPLSLWALMSQHLTLQLVYCILSMPSNT